jgi:hypothetical protein
MVRGYFSLQAIGSINHNVRYRTNPTIHAESEKLRVIWPFGRKMSLPRIRKAASVLSKI